MSSEGLFGVIKNGEKFEITYAWNGHNCNLTFESESAAHDVARALGRAFQQGMAHKVQEIQRVLS